jgi:hypothetical protein
MARRVANPFCVDVLLLLKHELAVGAALFAGVRRVRVSKSGSHNPLAVLHSPIKIRQGRNRNFGERGSPTIRCRHSSHASFENREECGTHCYVDAQEANMKGCATRATGFPGSVIGSTGAGPVADSTVRAPRG